MVIRQSNVDSSKKNDALQRRLIGISDARGKIGNFARGKNVYNSSSHAAHKGGGSQYGRPKENKIPPEVLLRALKRMGNK